MLCQAVNGVACEPPEFDSCIKAKLHSIITKISGVKGESKTTWIHYTSDDPRTDLRINCIIESENYIA